MRQTDWKMWIGAGATVTIAAAGGYVVIRERLTALETKAASITKLWEKYDKLGDRVSALEAKP